MPTSEGQLAIAEEKFRQLLMLADEIMIVRNDITRRLQAATHDGLFQRRVRNRVLVGLSIKALDSFDRLLVDARDRRAECSHHLKTMAESFIYSGWVSGDEGDIRAKMVCADGFRSRAAYHRALGEGQLEAEFDRLRCQVVEGLEGEWDEFKRKGLEELSAIANRSEHYHQVYRLACEAAHMGDLTVYMPPQPTEIGLRLSDVLLLRSYVCLKFGIIVSCDLLHDASDALGMSLDERLDNFRERWRTILAMRSSIIDE